MSRYFYVSVVEPDGRQRRALLAGPYATHEDALAAVWSVKHRAMDADPWMAFNAFGTSGSDEPLTSVFGVVRAAAR